jgi:hypothetical protein
MKWLSIPSKTGKPIMKKYFLLGLAACGLMVVATTESKADDGLRIFINPGYHQYRPYYYGGERYRYYRHSDEYRWHRYHHRHHYHSDDERYHDRD